jgi:two-component system cell cycle sensor histidine kinase/response regulator CckA
MPMLKTILLVEDDSGVRNLTRRILTSKGYHVLDAGDGMEAMDLCSRSDGAIDLVIADIVMPGMGGKELIQRLSSVCPRIKVIYISGHGSSDVLGRGGAEAGACFIQKPFTAEALIKAVRKLLKPTAR